MPGGGIQEGRNRWTGIYTERCKSGQEGMQEGEEVVRMLGSWEVGKSGSQEFRKTCRWAFERQVVVGPVC